MVDQTIPGIRTDGHVPGDVIPHGLYCYASLEPMDDLGRMKVRGMCPFWESRGEQNAYCAFLKTEDDVLLWDQVKICDVNPDEPTPNEVRS